jgi:phytanoyl-CoA hydroxylase
LIRGLIDPDEVIAPIIEEYHTVFDRLALELPAEGEISSDYKHLPFGNRVSQSGRVHSQYFDFPLPQKEVKPNTPFLAGPAVFRALVNEDLLDAVESLIGPEITSNSVQYVRIKPPEQYIPKYQKGVPILGATSWHRDHGVVLPEADETKILIVWFSLNDATIENGCLQIVPRSHRSGLLVHCPGGPERIKIPDQLFDLD